MLPYSGITNTLGRIMAGAMADLKCVNPLLMHNIAILGCGVTSILNQFCTTYPLMCLQGAVFGLCIGKLLFYLNICLQIQTLALIPHWNQCFSSVPCLIRVTHMIPIHSNIQHSINRLIHKVTSVSQHNSFMTLDCECAGIVCLQSELGLLILTFILLQLHGSL